MSASADTALNILVVDDEETVRETLLAFLEFAGHTVTVAENGLHALQLYEPGKFHVVFTDLSMPRMAGDALAAELKQRSPGQPIVMVTSLAATLTADSRAAVDLLIEKPFSI